MIDKLKPCPNCGARAGMLISCPTKNGKVQAFFVKCKSCLYRTTAHYAERTGQFNMMTERAIKEWNGD